MPDPGSVALAAVARPLARAPSAGSCDCLLGTALHETQAPIVPLPRESRDASGSCATAACAAAEFSQSGFVVLESPARAGG
jgi:hypothetical protein